MSGQISQEKQGKIAVGCGGAVAGGALLVTAGVAALVIAEPSAGAGPLIRIVLSGGCCGSIGATVAGLGVYAIRRARRSATPSGSQAHRPPPSPASGTGERREG